MAKKNSRKDPAVKQSEKKTISSRRLEKVKTSSDDVKCSDTSLKQNKSLEQSKMTRNRVLRNRTVKLNSQDLNGESKSKVVQNSIEKLQNSDEKNCLRSRERNVEAVKENCCKKYQTKIGNIQDNQRATRTRNVIQKPVKVVTNNQRLTREPKKKMTEKATTHFKRDTHTKQNSLLDKNESKNAEKRAIPELKELSICLYRCDAQAVVLKPESLRPTRNVRAKNVKKADSGVKTVAKKELTTVSKKKHSTKTLKDAKTLAKTTEARSSKRTRIKTKKQLEADLADSDKKPKEIIVVVKESPKVNQSSSPVACPMAANVAKVPSPYRITISKTISQSDENNEDPYSFELSQSEVTQKKVEKKIRKPRAKQKPGNKMDLLMKQQELDAAEYSCSVQNNPGLYKDQRFDLEKKLSEQVASAPKININLVQLRKVADKVVYSKVWHSPRCTDNIVCISVEQAGPAVSSFSDIPLQMVQAITRNQATSQAATPLRVTGNLPSAFYMGLSKNDGTPTFSSDLVDSENNRKCCEYSNIEPNGTNGSSNCAAQQSRQDEISEIGSLKTPSSILEDSNTENIQPAGYKSPNKKVARQFHRSPFKPLPLGASVLSLNNTTDKTFLNDSCDDDESIDLLLACEQVEKEYLKTRQTQSSTKITSNSAANESFGFDDLLDKDSPIDENQQQLSHTPTGHENIHEQLQNMRKYLPSNRNRNCKVVPSSPVKKLRILSSPSKAPRVNVQQFFSSSTPITSLRGKFVTSPDLSFDDETVSKPDDQRNIALFEDSVELYNTKRKYGRKRSPTKVRKDGKDELEVGTKADVIKPARKKFNIEETGEFKKFVHDKSNEFAEVDDYEMVIE